MEGKPYRSTMQMKTIEQFKDYCIRELNSDLAVLEKIRSRVHSKLITTAVIAGSIGMAILFLLQQKEYIVGIKPTVIAAGVILFVCFVIVALLSRQFAREYRAAYKMSVMDKFAKFLDVNLQYDPSDFVSGGVYSMANLFKQQAERFSGSDLVKGKIGDIHVEFSQVHSEYYHKGGKSSRWVTIFKGLFFVFGSNKNFSGQTIVLPDVAQNLLGKVGVVLQSLIPQLGQLVKFDDVEFEKYFVVYSENESQARAILSPALMQRAVEFRKKNRTTYLRLSFAGSGIFVAFSLQESFCEPQLFGPIINFTKIDQYLEYISFALGIVEEVNRESKTAVLREIPIGGGATAIL